MRSLVPEPQPLMAIALQGLTFGTVLPGVATHVPAADPHRAGVFEIRGPTAATVRLEFVLPDALAHENAPAFIPLTFSAGSASAGFGRGAGDQFLHFSPHAPLINPLSAEGRLFIRLGGSVSPGLPQQGGEYRATIYLTVYDLGS